MRTCFSIRAFFAVVIALTLSGASMARERSRQAVVAVSAPRVTKFTCLPKDVQLGEAITIGRGGRPAITVEHQLIEMKARCRNGRLVDAKRREIRFFRPSCWGNPPYDYLEIQQRENEELAKLKRHFRVIVFSCNPMIQ